MKSVKFTIRLDEMGDDYSEIIQGRSTRALATA